MAGGLFTETVYVFLGVLRLGVVENCVVSLKT
jgi:hypothetical protein